MSLGVQSQAWEVTLQAYSGQSRLAMPNTGKTRVFVDLLLPFIFVRARQRIRKGWHAVSADGGALCFASVLHLSTGKGLLKANEKEVTPG